MGPGDLARALCGLELGDHPNLLVGLERADDAGVYQLTDEIALIQTVDFFTPIVDEPVLFGQIAAANALSDVYAMGGRPLCALNIVCFPAKTLDISVLQEVLRGGLDKLREADTPLAGGHSIDDPEMKYGLSVTGVVHPRRLWTNVGGRPGDLLILTKALGTGVISTALKREEASAESAEAAARSMASLNRAAAELLQEADAVHACTDVTGFGLLGHASEMLGAGEVGMEIEAARVPLLPGALGCAAQGLRPGGLRRNRAFCAERVELGGDVPEPLQDLLYDPQTSGGLLAAVPAERADRLQRRLRERGVDQARVVGALTADHPGRIRLR